MERLYDLLFELSSEERHGILLLLKERPMNVTQLARKLDLSTQETSRHVQRIVEAELAAKNPNGQYYISPFGNLLLSQLTGTKFIVKNRQYFTSHILDRIPEGSRASIGELSDSQLIDNVMVMVHSVEETLRGAEEYLLDINVPYIASAFPLIGEAFARGVRGQFLHTSDLKIPPSMLEERVRYMDDRVMQRIRSSGLYQERVVDKADVVLYMSEKQVAIVSFPVEEQRFDYLGFASKDRKALAWCRDLFMHYWEFSRPVPIDE